MKKLVAFINVSLFLMTYMPCKASFRKSTVACIKSCSGSSLRIYSNNIAREAYKAIDSAHLDGNLDAPTLIQYSLKLDRHKNHPEFSKIAKDIIEKRDYTRADKFIAANKENSNKTSELCDDFAFINGIINKRDLN